MGVIIVSKEPVWYDVEGYLHTEGWFLEFSLKGNVITYSPFLSALIKKQWMSHHFDMSYKF